MYQQADDYNKSKKKEKWPIKPEKFTGIMHGKGQNKKINKL